MRRIIAGAVFGTALLLAPAWAQYQLVWEDDFDGTSLDLAKWEPQIGTGCPSLCGWGNNELQFYRAENATVSGGLLTITAKEEWFAGQQYTSARLRTKYLGDWERGRFEMRAKLPIGQGLWPAFWLLPTDSVYGVWAASGEIDVMESLGQDPDRVYGTIHYGGTFPDNVFSGGSYTLPAGTFHDAFHEFALEWDEFEMRWYVDGILYSTETSWWSSGGPYPAPFDQRFHLLLNLAVGGDWPGSPDGTTVFPQTFEIDYVRVYQEQPHDPADCVCVFDDMEHANFLANGYFTFDGPGAGGGIGANFLDLPPAQGGSVSLEAGWGAGGTPGYFGGFGRTRPLDISGATHFEMWIHPDAGQDYVLEINLQDDDNGDDAIPGSPDGADDEFQYSLPVSPTGPGAISGGGWQHIRIPLASFVDDNSFHFGGNGVFDPLPGSAGGNGRLVNVVFALNSNTGAAVTFRSDNWRFTRRTSFVAGRVFYDADGDGTGPGLAGVTVEAFDTSLGTVVATTVTGPGGQYSLNDLVGGSYAIRVDPSTLTPGATPASDPDGVATPHEFALALECDETLVGRDFGYVPPTPANYCVGAPNSVGAGAVIGFGGTQSVAANDFSLFAIGLPYFQNGIFYYGPNQLSQPFGEGFRCVGGTTQRLPVVQSDDFGFASFALDVTSPPSASGQITSGSSWNFQHWYRDPAGGPSGFNLSDGLSVTFWP